MEFPDFTKKDKRDEIIARQLDVIRTMTENSISRMSNDFWGTPFANILPKKPETPAAPEEQGSGQSETDAPAATSSGEPDAAEPKAEELPKENVDDLKAELSGYIGLSSIKKEVNSLINMVTIYQKRRENDLPCTDMSLHMVFSGNPGTGKTTVARMMARIYHSLDILSKGHLVEVDRSGLVAGYVGQTAIKTQKVIEKSLGGVLFIDEAYALNGHTENDFGLEAIDTILKAMEDHRDDLVVIVAGYDGLMDDFIHSNPGLESRFNRYLHFDDYNIEEMMKIFMQQCEKGCYELDEETRKAAQMLIAEKNTNSISFGNARGVRNIFEKVLTAQNNRLAGMVNITREDLMKIVFSDIEAAGKGYDKEKEKEAKDGK